MSAEQHLDKELIFWAPVTTNNRATLPELICSLAGIDSTKIVQLKILSVKDKPKEA